MSPVTASKLKRSSVLSIEFDEWWSKQIQVVPQIHRLDSLLAKELLSPACDMRMMASNTGTRGYR